MSVKLSTAVSCLFLWGVSVAPLLAQSLADGIFMPRRQVCVGISAAHESFHHYWEGSLHRENANIGTVTTQSMGVMAAYGITSRLNAVAMLPYVRTSASAGTLAPQRGLQDVGIGLKWKALGRHIRPGDISLDLAAGGSLPTTNYVADYLPLSIGMGCKTAFGRAILHFVSAKKLSFTAQGSYMLRSNVALDRDAYYTDHLIESSEVSLPDVANFSVRTGYYAYRWGLEGVAERTQCVSGNDIRRQDMPFLSNRMENTRVGGIAHYRLPWLFDVQVVGQYYYTIAGRNAGQSSVYSLGLFKVFGHEPSK